MTLALVIADYNSTLEAGKQQGLVPKQVQPFPTDIEQLSEDETRQLADCIALDAIMCAKLKTGEEREQRMTMLHSGMKELVEYAKRKAAEWKEDAEELVQGAPEGVTLQ